MLPQLLRFADQDSLTHALADSVTRRLQDALSTGRSAAMAVPGGRTPIPFFERLSQAPLAWERVRVTLTDERWVDISDAASNERLVRTHLQRNRASSTQILGLRGDSPDSEDGAVVGATLAWLHLSVIERPFDVVIVGMGDDGHFASLFPGDAASMRGLDPAQAPDCLAARAPLAPWLRVSLNLSALLQTRELVLLATGEQKGKLLQQELDAATSRQLPVRALLAQQRTPVTIYWSP